MTRADDVDGILAAMVGEPLDEYSPELVVHSARLLGRDDLTDIEERELIEAGGVVLEVVFELGPEQWLRHLGVDLAHLPGASDLCRTPPSDRVAGRRGAPAR